MLWSVVCESLQNLPRTHRRMASTMEPQRGVPEVGAHGQSERVHIGAENWYAAGCTAYQKRTGTCTSLNRSPYRFLRTSF